jgi:hypothetical protein
MTDAILNTKRRLERHTRRDGELQSRTRPVAVERDGEDASSVAYIRNFVEKSDMADNELARRLLVKAQDVKGSSAGTGGGASTAAGPAATRAGGNNGNGNGNGVGIGNQRTTPVAATTRRVHTATRERSTAQPIVIVPTLTSTTSQQTMAIVTVTSSSSTRTHHTHTKTSTSSSAMPTTTMSSSSSSSTSMVPSTAVAFVTASPSASANIAASSSTATSKPSSGVGVGPIIGIVAGALAGIAIIAVIVGYLFKKYGRKEDPYEADPFSPDDFRRQSSMLPDTYEHDEGYNDMSEYQNASPFGNDVGYGAAAAAAGGAGVGAAGLAAASSFRSHNESGGPRPPSMFEKHINSQATRYNSGEPMGTIYDEDHNSPQLPAMAFGGSDPYTTAGVGRSHQQMDNNISNPYAHLDRSPSAMVQRNVSQNGQHGGQEVFNGAQLAHGSNGSSYQQYSSDQYHPAGQEYESNGHGYDTAGRPGTSEGRSGTPDLPNVQQTYAGTGIDESQGRDRVVSPHHMMASPEQMPHEYYNQANYADENNAPHQPLQVRNLLPNQQRMAQQHGQGANDDAAYGGLY